MLGWLVLTALYCLLATVLSGLQVDAEGCQLRAQSASSASVEPKASRTSLEFLLATRMAKKTNPPGDGLPRATVGEQPSNSKYSDSSGHFNGG